MNREQRDTLLLGDWNSASGGGQPLPEALRAVLSYLYENGFTVTSVLHKIIREQHVVEFKSTRILEVWNTWESFCNAILGALHDAELISGDFGDGWMITGKAVPGRELTVIRIIDGDKDRRTRVTFRSESERVMRNEMQVVKNSIDTLLVQVSKIKDNHSVYEQVNQYLLACAQALREALNGKPPAEEQNIPSVPSPARRVRQKLREERREGGDVKEWVYSYMTAHPMQLMSIQEIAAAFDEHDADNISSGRYGNVNTGTITKRLRDLNITGPGRIEWLRPPDARRVSAMYVPPGWDEKE